MGDHHTITAYAGTAAVEILEAQFTPEELGDPSYVVNPVGFSHAYDTRDDPVLPRRGLILEERLEYGFALGGGEIQFARGMLRFSA